MTYKPDIKAKIDPPDYKRASKPTSALDDRFGKAPCSRCGQDTYRISYLWKDGRNYLVCAECFKAHAAPYLKATP